MEYNNFMFKQKVGKNKLKSGDKLNNIKADYFLKNVFNNLEKKRTLNIVKYNKNLMKRINININDYKEYSEIYTLIEIEIKPVNNKYGKFINIKKEDEKYYHIYFNNKEEEIGNKTYINKKDKVTKIRIVIDYQVKSFGNLFLNCKCIKSINFKKFNRNNIDNMSYMFYECSFLEELNLSNFKTNNVSDMSYIFFGCKLLKELNLSNFNTSIVNDMQFMFSQCNKLKEIKGINNFNTSNVTDMIAMFQQCNEIEYLDLYKFTPILFDYP